MDWLEFLIPAIIIAVYFFGGLAGKKGGDEKDPREMTPEEAEAQAERERAQAEIRKRILAKRREAEEAYQRKQAGTATPPPTPLPVAERREARPMRRPSNIPQAPVHPGRPQAPTAPDFSWEQNRRPHNPFSEQMAERRQQIEETEQKAAALRQQHGLDTQPARKRAAREIMAPMQVTTSTRRNLRALLARPSGVRTAFMLAEIVDKPVALRTQDRKI